jgi:hypothetical protein
MIEYLISFASGALVKTVDSADEHGLKLNKILKFSFAILYGIAIAYLMKIIFLPEFFLGIMLGVLFYGKIDTNAHKLGFASFLLGFLLFKPMIFNWAMVLIISLLCFFEEWVNDNIADKKKVKGVFLKFLSVRPILEITAAVLSIIYLNFSIFFLLILFDAGYLASKKFIA